MDVIVDSSPRTFDESIGSMDLNHFESLLQNWSPDTFQYIIDYSSSQGSSVFSTFSWEIFDKVFDYSLSSTRCTLNALLQTVELIASNNRPRELYMMAVEKIVGSGSELEPFCLSVLLFAMQLALVALPSPSFMRDGLPLVYKAILDSSASTNTVPASLIAGSFVNAQDFRRLSVTGIALGFCEGLACR